MRLFTNETTGKGWDQNVSSVNKFVPMTLFFNIVFKIGYFDAVFAGNAEELWSFTW